MTAMIWQQYCWEFQRPIDTLSICTFYSKWLVFFFQLVILFQSCTKIYFVDHHCLTFRFRLENASWKIIHTANDLAPKYLYFPESYLVWPVLIIFYTPYLSTNQIRCYILVLFITQIVNIKYRKNSKENDKIHIYQLTTGEIYDELSNKIRRSPVWPFVC